MNAGLTGSVVEANGIGHDWLWNAEVLTDYLLPVVVVLLVLLLNRRRLLATFNAVVAIPAYEWYVQMHGDRSTGGRHRQIEVARSAS